MMVEAGDHEGGRLILLKLTPGFALYGSND